MLRITTAGESHGPALTAILEGMPAGLELAGADLDSELLRRQVGNREGKAYQGASPRMKIEKDHAEILGGVMEGKTIGSPIALLIHNADHAKWSAKPVPAMTIPRPGHADLPAALKFGYDDLRMGLERASARETAARVAACAICKKFLTVVGISIGSAVLQIGEVKWDPSSLPIPERLLRAESSNLRCPDPQTESKMADAIEKAMKAGDTLGGVFEVVAWDVPPGLGSSASWEERLSSRIGAAMLGIQAVKGVEIGAGFALASLPGTKAQDPILREGENVVRGSNHMGGIEAGITNGQPVVVRAAMKPIATTIAKQRSIDLANGEESSTNYERSDFCCVPRAAIVAEGMLAFILAKAVLEKCGGDSMAEVRERFAKLPRGKLSDFSLRSDSKVFWE